MIKNKDDLKLNDATVIDCKSINDETYALIKHKIGSYSVVQDPFVHKGKIIDFRNVRFFQNFLVAQYHYRRMLNNALNKSKKRAVMER